MIRDVMECFAFVLFEMVMMALVNAWAAVMVLLALKFLQIVAVAYKPMAAVAVVAAVDPVPEC